MKKLLVSLLLIGATLPALAQHRHHGHHGHWQRGYNSSWNWVVPAVIGGVVVYSATRPDPVIIQQQPVIVQNPSVIVQQETCSAWREIQASDGTIYRERTCTK